MGLVSLLKVNKQELHAERQNQDKDQFWSANLVSIEEESGQETDRGIKMCPDRRGTGTQIRSWDQGVTR